MPRGELEIRCCFCEAKPLLAVCGRDQRTGQPFVHVKAYRSLGRGQRPRIYAEAVVTSGTVRLRCRECFRWHKVTIRRVAVDSKPERLPEGISL